MPDPKRSAATTLYDRPSPKFGDIRPAGERVQQTRHEPSVREQARTEAERANLRRWYPDMR